MTAITARMQALGLPGTKLRRHMMDTAAARRGDENVSTPAELARLLLAMHGPADSARPAMEPAIELLKKPKESRLRRGLPESVDAADKPGELDGVRVDAGIVFARNRSYVFAVMMTFLKDEMEGERAIVEMSRASFEYFSRLGSGGVYGRKMP
jgi:beta-lactamase class A